LKFQVKSGDILAVKSDAVIVGIFEGAKSLSGVTANVDKRLGNAILELIKIGEFKGKASETHVIHTLGKMPSRLVLVVGLGKKEKLNVEKIRNVMAESARILRKHSCKRCATVVAGAGINGISLINASRAISEGFILGSYQFRRHLTEKDEHPPVDEIICIEQDSSHISSIKKGLEIGQIIAQSTLLARDMVNEPGNYMTPVIMADKAKEIAKNNNLELTILERDQMLKEKMGALLGVAQGTNQPPRFMIINYKGAPSKKETIGFVGKGLTFDSGGISLKPQDFMSDMKGDMAGGAAVIGAIDAIAKLKLKINVTAIIPATENLPGGKALKPGDVVKASNGKTIEVVNTDAEGRLILADALSYAVKKGISPLIDLATLTGACHVALGDQYAGLFTNNQELADKLLKAGKTVGEPLWQLPLPDDYKELNKSDIADIKNSGGRYGGAITAALFLQEFVGNTPWVHLDIAAPFMADKTKGVYIKGATGFGVRTLVELAMNLSEGKEKK
jgi:leucyl aminopeptidase